MIKNNRSNPTNNDISITGKISSAQIVLLGHIVLLLFLILLGLSGCGHKPMRPSFSVEGLEKAESFIIDDDEKQHDGLRVFDREYIMVAYVDPHASDCDRMINEHIDTGRIVAYLQRKDDLVYIYFVPLIGQQTEEWLAAFEDDGSKMFDKRNVIGIYRAVNAEGVLDWLKDMKNRMEEHNGSH